MCPTCLGQFNLHNGWCDMRNYKQFSHFIKCLEVMNCTTGLAPITTHIYAGEALELAGWLNCGEPRILTVLPSVRRNVTIVGQFVNFNWLGLCTLWIVEGNLMPPYTIHGQTVRSLIILSYISFNQSAAPTIIFVFISEYLLPIYIIVGQLPHNYTNICILYIVTNCR